MDSIDLHNDEVLTIPLVGLDQNGNVEFLVEGDSFSVKSNSDPTAVQAVVVDGKLVLNAMKRSASGVVVEVMDSKGLKPAEVTVNVVADPAPVAVGLDLAHATSKPQPVPAA